MCLRSNPPWAQACAACGAQLASGDYRPPEWLLSPRGAEPPIFAMRRRRRRRQWWTLGIALLLVAGAFYGNYARKVLNTPAAPRDLGGTEVVTGWETESIPGITEPEPTESGPAATTESAESEVGSGAEETPAPEGPLEAGGALGAIKRGIASLRDRSYDIAAGEQPAPITVEPTYRRGRTSVARAPGGGRRPAVSPPVGRVPGPGPTGPSTPPSEVTTAVWERDGAVMVQVLGGTFRMGSTTGDESEGPVREVSIDTFWIDRTEVTNEQYKKFVDATGRPVPYVAESWAKPYNWDRAARTYPDGKGNHPVVLVSWDEAAAYALWAGKRLPTEAEWEYAARGPGSRTYPWGNAWDASRCNWLSDALVEGLAPVGSYPSGASWCGALDMAGNVWEWCADWFAPDAYSAAARRNPSGPVTGRYRVLRGGSWGSPADLCRSSARAFRPPYARSDAAGFRCAADRLPSS